MTIITLTTDFGTTDYYVAALKGVVAGIAPAAQVIDITHEISAQNVRQAAYVLAAAVPFFPPGTIHVVVVDPGVGSARRPLAIASSNAMFVGPDNGVFTPVLDTTDLRVVHLNRPEFWRPVISHTFHGRDIFAPVAAHLARGVALAELGDAINDPWKLDLEQPARLTAGGLQGEVVHIDRFGNLITNIPSSWLAGQRWLVRIAGQTLDGVQAAYASVAPGQLLALVSSGDTLEIAVREGNAARQIAAGIGEPVVVWPRGTGDQ